MVSLKKSYSELSKRNDGTSLILSDLTRAYSYDEIVESIAGHEKPTSADAILLSPNNARKIVLIEFKSGFDKIDVVNKRCCDNQNKVCQAIEKVSKRSKKNQISELKSNIILKGVESLWFLCMHVGSRCVSWERANHNITYIVVIDKADENPVDAIAEVYTECGNVLVEKGVNVFIDLRTTLHRLGVQCTSGNKIYYDQVEVLSTQEFENRFCRT